MACLYGHIEIVKYLHENGCPWGEEAVAYAAHNGHLEIVKYLRDNEKNGVRI